MIMTHRRYILLSLVWSRKSCLQPTLSELGHVVFVSEVLFSQQPRLPVSFVVLGRPVVHWVWFGSDEHSAE